MSFDKPNAFVLYSVIVLYHGGELLLLKRASTKAFAPGRWTGVGGRVEADEFDDLERAALRELKEEASLDKHDIDNLTLRRVLYHNRFSEPLTGLLYFTAHYQGEAPACPDGELHWKRPEVLGELDIIETTRQTLTYLIDDIRRDPEGDESVKIGVTHYGENGKLTLISWSGLPNKVQYS